ncbi:MbtH family NRPS accessory protein [Streptomyces olivaceus]|uniref:MbtH family NRPS accessory protein n=1 Tax=Streptomyces olivaceus TaxID=47716 RepID=A0ABS7WEE0_STROV|nr:MbtH family NRPS accessory protein [Streptomyces olivaceus]MBZ6100432.1 MbtH family NRPS accessory protein [Streptomyces olivaceus]MBZ6121596.1 MbtH family NRPS accessory protein [Streptomyces olivaceus]MBZ6156332.1 MbtH family NRPS accessory protein [Streptomyces olivaceus]MBZ6302858.1 MbtH family NRPS accessory protein [Streptomyces olivaceus]
MYFTARDREEKCSTRRSGRSVPDGWETVEGPEAKDICLSRIEELRSDMRPAILRAAATAAENKSA